MTKEQKIAILNECKDKTKIACVCFKYDKNRYYYYPNEINGSFLLAQEEKDFQLDGFHIRKLSHITKVEMESGLYSAINVWNGVTKQIAAPEINLSSWETVFDKLRYQNDYLIIEDEINGLFAIGKVVKVNRGYLTLREFDADGVWQEDLLIIRYSSITHVAWGTRYSQSWYAYLNREQ